MVIMFARPLNDHVGYRDVAVSRCARCSCFGVFVGHLEQVIGRVGIEISGFGRMLGVRFVGGHSIAKERGSGRAGPFEVF